MREGATGIAIAVGRFDRQPSVTDDGAPPTPRLNSPPAEIAAPRSLGAKYHNPIRATNLGRSSVGRQIDVPIPMNSPRCGKLKPVTIPPIAIATP